MSVISDQKPSRERTSVTRHFRPVSLAVVALIGVALMVYPVFATQFNDLKHRENATNYEVNVQVTDELIRAESLARADEYNVRHKGNVVLDPYLHRVAHKTPEYEEYLTELDLLPEMATVRIPSLDITLPVYHGTEDAQLKKGVGHLYGSSLPVGGKGTHSVLTGHTGLGDATLFNKLTDIKVGDSVYLNTEGRHLKYVVTGRDIVLPTEYESLNRKDPDKDLLTLITCTPYGINSHRLLVTAERAPLDAITAEELRKPPAVRLQWDRWMIILLIVAVISLAVVGTQLWRWQRALNTIAHEGEDI